MSEPGFVGFWDYLDFVGGWLGVAGMWTGELLQRLKVKDIFILHGRKSRIFFIFRGRKSRIFLFPIVISGNFDDLPGTGHNNIETMTLQQIPERQDLVFLAVNQGNLFDL